MRGGFTVLEFIIATAIIVIVLGLSVPVLTNYESTSRTDAITDIVSGFLRRAQMQSIIGQDASAWGVYFDTSNHEVVLYQGGTYATRNSSYDTVYGYTDAMSITPSFGSEVVFSLYSGTPSATGTVSLVHELHGTQTITITDHETIERE